MFKKFVQNLIEKFYIKEIKPEIISEVDHYHHIAYDNLNKNIQYTRDRTFKLDAEIDDIKNKIKTLETRMDTIISILRINPEDKCNH